MADDIDSLLDEVEDKYVKKNTRQPVKPAVKQNTVNHTTSQQKTKRLVLYHFKSRLWLFSVTQDLKSHTLVIKRIIWFHFSLLPYAHCGLSYVSLIAVQSFGAVAPIEKAGEAIKVIGFHT